MNLLEAERLAVDIGRFIVCRELSLTIEPGQCWAVLGANGAGKTTLLHTLAGLHQPSAGEIRLEGRALRVIASRQRARRVGVLFQTHPDPFLSTALESVLTGRHPYLARWQWADSAGDVGLGREALAEVGLAGFEQRTVASLSGGERQRLAIATVLIQAPRVYLLDEPSNHLDLHHQIDLLDRLLARARSSDAGVLMIVHDVNLAIRFCDHALMLFGDGSHRLGPCDTVLTAAELTRLYRHPLEALEHAGRRVFLPA